MKYGVVKKGERPIKISWYEEFKFQEKDVNGRADQSQPELKGAGKEGY